MKKILMIFPVLILVIGFTGGKLIDDKIKELYKQFKTDDQSAKSTVFYNISGPSFYIPNVKVLKSMAVGERTAIIDYIGKQIKDYVSTSEFKEQYNNLRMDKKPVPPEVPKSSEEMKKEQRENLITAIAEMEKNKAQMPEDQQEMMDGIIEGYKQTLKDLDNPDYPMNNPEMDSYMQQSYQLQLEEHNKNIAEWEKQYPLNNPNPMIKTWINSFLDESKDINFDAKTTVNKDGIFKFNEQKYEAKNSQWKLYYRAGRENVNAARKFAQNWLSELQ